MYMSRVIEIGKADNGYVIEARVPLKPEKKSDAKAMISEYPGSCEKKFIAKNHMEVSTILGKLLPMLDEDYATEKEFDKAFGDAAEQEDD